MFADHMDKTMEVYIDDILVKIEGITSTPLIFGGDLPDCRSSSTPGNNIHEIHKAPRIKERDRGKLKSN